MPALLEPTTPPAASKYDDAVRGTLDDTARKIRSSDALTGGLVVAAGVLLYAVSAVLLDRWLDLPAWARQLGLVVLLAAAGTAGWYLVARPLRRQVNPRYVARKMEGTIGDAKNAVINWVDLHDRDIPGSVKTALGQKAAAGLAEADPADAVSGRRMAWAGGTVAVLVGVLAVLFLLFKSQFLSLLGRAFNPFSDRGIVARTAIELIEPTGDRTLTDGQQLGFVVRVTGHIPVLGSPEQVRLKVRYAPDATEFDEYPLTRGETIRDYSLTAGRPILQNGMWYRIAAGDAETPEYRVTVRARPMIQTFEARYEYPEYLRLKPDVGRPNEPRLNGYRGTNVTLTVKTNRTVKLGTLTTVIAGQDTAIPGEVVGDAKDSLQFKLTLQDRGEYTINFTSTEGEVSGPTVPYPIDVDIDAAPTITIQKPEQEEITLPTNGLLEVDAKIDDDHGVAAAVLRFKLANGPALAPKPFRDGKSFKRDTDGSFPTALDYKDSVKLDSLKTADGKTVELKPDAVLEYWLEATDNCTAPGANVGKSKVQRVKLTAPPADPMKQQEQKTQQQQQQDKRQQDEKKNNQQQDEKNKTEKRDTPPPQNRDKDPQQPDQPKDPQPNGEKDPKPPEQDPTQKPDPKNPMDNGQGGNDPKPNPEDQKNQDKAKELENKIKEQENQAGGGKGDPNQQEKSKPEEKPAQGKPGDKGQPPPDGASENKPDPMADPMNPMDQKGNTGEGKKGDVQQPNKSEAKPEPKAGEDPNGSGDPDAMPKEGPKPDDKQGAGGEKSSKPQPGEAEKPPLKPGEKPRDSDPAGGKGSGDPDPDKKDPMDPKPEPKPGEKGGAKDAGKGKPNGDVNPGEQKPGDADPMKGDPAERPKGDEKPADGKGKKPLEQGTAKPEKKDPMNPMAGKPEPGEGKEPGTDPMKGDKESGEGKGEGDKPDPMKGEKPVPKGEQKPGQKDDGGKGAGDPDPKNPDKNPMGTGEKEPPKPPDGGKGQDDAAKQKEIADAMKDLGSDDKAKRDAAKEKLDKTIGPDARKQAEEKAKEIADDMKSGDPKRQEDAKKKLEEMAKQAGKNGDGGKENGKPRELTEQEKKDLADAAKDLGSKDDDKRKAAEQKLDEQIGQDARQEIQKDVQDLTGNDPEKAKAAKEKLERMAKEAKNQNEIPQGGNPPKGPDGKPLEDSPENRLKSSELQLENFKKYKDNPEFLKKAGYSQAEYEKFLKGYEETVARQRAAVDAAKAVDPRTPGTDPKRNVSDGSGADTRLVGPKTQLGGPSAGGASEAPPGFGEAHKRFIEEAMKKGKK